MRFFRIETFKHKTTDTTHDEWSNSYCVETPDSELGVEQPALAEIANHILNAEANIHLPFVVIDRATISTYEKDQAGVHQVVRTIGAGFLGKAILPADDLSTPLILESCLAISFAPVSGRASTKLYRGCLHGDMFERVENSRVLKQDVQTNIINTFMQPLSGNNSFESMVVVSEFEGGLVGRHIFSVALKGVRQRQRFQSKKPKLSQDEDAIITRITEAAKEGNYILASMRAFDGFKDYQRTDAVLAALAEWKKVAEQVGLTDITVNAQ